MRATPVHALLQAALQAMLAVSLLLLSAANAQESTAPPQPYFLSVDLNEARVADSLLVQRVINSAGKDDLLLPESAIAAWRLKVEGQTATTIDGVRYYALSALQGLSFKLDEATQNLIITAIPSAFQTYEGRYAIPSGPLAARTGNGGFLSYDALSQSTRGKHTLSAALDVGFYNPYGVLMSGFLVSRQLQSALPDTTTQQRLETVFVHDDPKSMTSLLIGDSITRSAGWGRAARFGGLQWGSNFATQPMLRTYPLQTASGQVALPSIVDVYVNNVLTSRQQIPAGPFTLRDLPIVDGAGQIRLVTSDGLGRDQIFTQTFYGSTQLLAPGLHDYALSFGALRQDFGLKSNQYGNGIASGLWRHGLNDRLTLELGAEASRKTQVAGVGAATLLPILGELSGSIANSHTKSESAGNTQPDPTQGSAYALTLAHRTQSFSISWNSRIASAGFRVAGLSPNEILPRRETSFATNYGKGWGSLSLAYVSQWRPGSDRLDLATLNLATNLGQYGYLNLTALKPVRGSRGSSIFLNYVMPLDIGSFWGVTSQTAREGSKRRNENRINYQRTLPTGTGLGYRVELSDQDSYVADVRYQHSIGLASLEVARQSGLNGVRVGATGSITYIGGELMLGRSINEGFGLVQVPGYANVQVYLDNQPLGKTDTKGNYFVSRLRPYQPNRISIEQADLPMDAEIVSLKMDVAPYFKSGLVIQFPVKPSHGALLKIINRAGNPVKPGSEVILLGTGQTFPVAASGETYLTGLTEQNTIRVTEEGKTCTIHFNFTPSNDPQPHLGSFVCNLEN